MASKLITDRQKPKSTNIEILKTKDSNTESQPSKLRNHHQHRNTQDNGLEHRITTIQA